MSTEKKYCESSGTKYVRIIQDDKIWDLAVAVLNCAVKDWNRKEKPIDMFPSLRMDVVTFLHGFWAEQILDEMGVDVNTFLKKVNIPIKDNSCECYSCDKERLEEWEIIKKRPGIKGSFTPGKEHWVFWDSDNGITGMIERD